MKKLITIVALVAISMSVTAQITNIKMTDDSSVVIDKLYVGMLSGTNFTTDSLHANGFTGVRIGAMGTYSPISWLALKGWGMIQFDGDAKPSTLQQFWVKMTPIHKLSLEFGSMATLATEQRPHPVSGNGQFETWTESQICGMAINAKLKYDITKDFQLAGGIAVRNDKPEYSAKITYKKVQLSSWYSEYNKKFGTALTLDFDKVYNTFVWREDQVLSNILTINLISAKGITFYADNGYDLATKKLVRCENGFLKTFNSKWFNGLWGFGWDHKKNGVSLYLFAHL
jgi:hypothetical protein